LSRRRSTIKHAIHHANEHVPQLSKTVELEQRLARVEICCEELTVINNRVAALQAQLDHLLAKLGLL
jgi:ubiquinone biosynthesis protein UbiJ